MVLVVVFCLTKCFCVMLFVSFSLLFAIASIPQGDYFALLRSKVAKRSRTLQSSSWFVICFMYMKNPPLPDRLGDPVGLFSW